MNNFFKWFIGVLNLWFQNQQNKDEFQQEPDVADDDIEDGSDIPEDCPVCVYDIDEEDPVVIPVEPDIVKIKAPRYLWCINNGHGSLQAGKRSPVWYDKQGARRQFHEYIFTRAVVAYLLPMLKERGILFYEVVPEVHVGSFLTPRIDRGNNKRSHLDKIWLGIHSNAAPVPNSVTDWCKVSIRGIETWFYHTSTKGRKAATIFQRFLINGTGWRNRNIKSRDINQFSELKKTKMVAVLVELGFYNNPEEVLELDLEVIQKDFARLLCDAISYIEVNGLDVSKMPKLSRIILGQAA